MDRAEIHQALSAAGEVGQDLLKVDWKETPLGPPDGWSRSLRTMVQVLLTSRFSLWMAWGPELTFFCNEAYRRDTLGQKYPWALGRPAGEVWAEIWPDIGPRIEQVLRTGEATWDEDLLLFLGRSGYVEETYHTFSYSPLPDDDGSIAGMLCVVSEETKRVISERRMATLLDLGSDLTACRTEQDVFDAVTRQLAGNHKDFPFGLVYLFEPDRPLATLRVTTGVAAGDAAAPLVVADTDRPAPVVAATAAERPAPVWPAVAARRGRSTLVDLRQTGLTAPPGPWPEPPTQALVTPLRPQVEGPSYGFLVAGLNPFRQYDADYQGFVELVAGQIAACIARVRAYEAERRRAEELAALDQAKTTFFTNVSHEFRTPLTLLLGPAEDALADRSNPLEEVQRQRLELIRGNAQRLLTLVNSLLDFSRLASGQADGRYQPTDLSAYTAQLATSFQVLTAQAGLQLVLDCPTLPEPVFLDREMWAKVVLNLLSNALKFTFAGSITVRIRDLGQGVELAVADTGVGIAAADQARLFERFHRVVGTRSRSFEGTGIGLALVAELVKLHGGTVCVDSQLGVGSTFRVQLPVGFQHLPEQQVTTAAAGEATVAAQVQGVMAEARRWLQAPVGAEPGPSAAPFPAVGATAVHGAPVPAVGATPEPEATVPAGDGQRAQILVVDDNADMRAYIAGVLHGVYTVEVAADGLSALAAAQSFPPDLVLTDVMMPNLDGFGLLAALRDDARTAAVPVIMVSARAGEDGVVEGLQAGADDYLVKPFSARELLARVRTHVELDRARRARRELERSRALLDQAQRLAQLGSWEMDLVTRRFHASDHFHRILGTSASDSGERGLEAMRARVHPDDRAAAAALLAAVQAGADPDGTLRIVRPDGQLRWIRVRGEVLFDAQGSPIVVRGGIQDVTEQRQAELALAEAEAQRQTLAREHQIADELQASLLPDPVFEHNYLQVATYYQAGVEGTYVGGDWYDVIELAADRTALVIGDVMGRGVRAAVVMGQLRSAVRAYARLDLNPAQVLERLDPVVEDLGGDHIVTCVYAVYDPASTTLNYANAGHLPPLLRHPDGSISRLSRAAAPPLGSGNSQFEEQLVRVGEGATVVLYTDGLIERRGSDLEQGIDDLARQLRTLGGELISQPAALVEGLRPDGPDDDIAVLMARVPLTEAPLAADTAAGKGGASPASPPADRIGWVPAELTLADGPDAVPAARQLARRRLAGADPALRSVVELVLSELVTNAVLHGRPPVVLRLRGSDQSVRIEVEDTGRNLPVRLQHNTDLMTGRGLSLITSLAYDWGINPGAEQGKVVWAEVRAAHLGEHGEGPSPLELDAVAASWPDDESIHRYAIRLGAVPTDLLIAAKAHVDNAVRELTLLGGQQARGGEPLTPDMVTLVETVTKDFAEARTEIKRQAAAAASRGQPLTNLELHLPLSAAEAGERYLVALDRVDRHARSARLLTLAAPSVHRLFRRWYVRALVDQLRALAAGQEPPPARSFAQVLADEVTRLTDGPPGPTA